MAAEDSFAQENGVVTLDPSAAEETAYASDAILGIVIEPQSDLAALKYTPHAGI